MLTAIILVSLATVLAVSIAFGTAMNARRAASSFTVEQGVLLAALAEELAANLLKEDAQPRSGRANPDDTPNDKWAQPNPPFEIAEGVTLEGRLDDESGKFNLNTLIGAKDDDGNQPIDAESMEIFTYLLEKVGLEPKWAPLIVDFIDQDPNPTTNGGEDNIYTMERPGYRAANGWITSPSELLSLPKFGQQRYEKLLPYVTALPPDSRGINVCFAREALLDAILSVYEQKLHTEYTQATDPGALAKLRTGGCFPGKDTILRSASPSLDGTRRERLNAKIVQQSEYFRLRTWVTIGTTEFALYSLLHRDIEGNPRRVTLVSRSFGTE